MSHASHAAHIRVWHDGTCTVLIFEGEFDVSTLHKVERAIKLVDDAQPATMMFDLHDVAFFGIRAAVRLQDALWEWSRCGIRCALLSSPAVDRGFDVLARWEALRLEAMYHVPDEVDDDLRRHLDATQNPGN